MKDLPVGTYKIKVEYENDVLGLYNMGMPIMNEDYPKVDGDMLAGTLISNTVEIVLRK